MSWKKNWRGNIKWKNHTITHTHIFRIIKRMTTSISLETRAQLIECFYIYIYNIYMNAYNRSVGGCFQIDYRFKGNRQKRENALFLFYILPFTILLFIFHILCFHILTPQWVESNWRNHVRPSVGKLHFLPLNNLQEYFSFRFFDRKFAISEKQKN